MDGTQRPYLSFDAATSTGALAGVLEAVEAFVPWYSGVHCGAGYKSQASALAYEGARLAALAFAGRGPDSGDVAVIRQNATDAISYLAGLGLSRGDVVVTTMAETLEEAAAELVLLDYDFHLFTERSTGQDSTIYRTPGGYQLAMADPKPGRLGPLPGSVTVSLLPAPRLTVQEATGRLDAAGQPFTFFVDARTGRGSLVYHRYDGHYGLLVPAGVRY